MKQHASAVTNPIWPTIDDEALVERLIPALQRTIADACSDHAGAPPNGDVPLPAPEVGNVLLMLLASILATSPQCGTPRGVRLMGEAAGRELACLIRDARAVQTALGGPAGTA